MSWINVNSEEDYMNKVKPFYIKHNVSMSDFQVATTLDKSVQCGARLFEGVHYKNGNINPHWCKYFGVTSEGNTYFSMTPKPYGKHAVEITLDQVDEHLGLEDKEIMNLIERMYKVGYGLCNPKLPETDKIRSVLDKLYPVGSLIPVSDSRVLGQLSPFFHLQKYDSDYFIRIADPSEKPKQSLRGTKIDLRKSDGNIDEELSAAFQEACFEQGIYWADGRKSIRSYSGRGFSFIYVSDTGLSYGRGVEYFKNDKNKQIQFSYNRKLEWGFKDMTEQRKVITLGGVEYYEDDVMAALALLETAKVIDDEVVSPQAGGGTPPVRN